MKRNLLKSLFPALVFSIILIVASVPLFASSAESVTAVSPINDEEVAAQDGGKTDPAGGKTAEDTSEEGAAEDSAVITTEQVKVSLPSAAKSAEKMYYCGELYIFSDSMLKTNYEMAAIAANLKEAVRTEALLKSAQLLDDLILEYNRVGASYNSWVDVKPEMENFVASIQDKNIYTKPNLQTAFRYTLTTVQNTTALLESARVYIEEPSTEGKRALNSAADKAVRSATKANNAVEPMAKRAMTGYRLFFDEFAQFAGIELDYH